MLIKKYMFIAVLLCTAWCAAAQNTQVHIRPGIARMAAKLEKDKMLHFGAPVGFAGKRETNNKYYRLYQKLKNKATNEELVALTQHNTSVPKLIYSFEILYHRKYAGLKNIFLEHINDTTWYWTAGGCTGVLNRVNLFMFRLMRSGNYLIKEESMLYCERFKKLDEWMSCE